VGLSGSVEWAGKFAARADDLLNLIPARLTAVGLALAGPGRTTVLLALPREAARYRITQFRLADERFLLYRSE